MTELPSKNILRRNVLVLSIDEVDRLSWDRLLDNACTTTPFHNLDWIRALHETYPSIKPELLIFESGGEYLGGFPYVIMKRYGFLKFLVSLPFRTYGGPVVRDDAPPDVARALWESVHKIIREQRISAIRTINFHAFSTLSPPSYYKPHLMFTHQIPLVPDYNHVLKKIYTHSVRTMLRQTREKGVLVEKVANEAGVKEFARIVCDTDKRHGEKPLPERLFINLFRCMGDHCLYHLAYHEGRAIAGILSLVQGDSVHNWKAASYPEFWHLHPNNALVDHVVRWAVEHKKKWCDLGTSPRQAYNLIRYKERWGAKLYNYNMWEWESRSLRSIRRFLGKVE